MVGVIRARDLLYHPFIAIHCFGWRTFYLALRTDSRETFLSLLGKTDFFKPAASEAVAIIQRCIDLELRAKRIYETLSETMAGTPAAEFFAVLAGQEQDHADLLKISLAASHQSGWKLSRFNPWRDYLPRLEQQMREAEYAASAVEELDEALRLVVRLESSEINLVFRKALTAGDTAFTKRLYPFQSAVETHVSYILTGISRLSPNLTMVSRELRTRFSHSI